MWCHPTSSLLTHTSQLLHVHFTEELLSLDRTECFVHDGAFLQFSFSITTKKKEKKKSNNDMVILQDQILSVILRYPTFLLLHLIFLQLVLLLLYCLGKQELNLWHKM